MKYWITALILLCCNLSLATIAIQGIDGDYSNKEQDTSSSIWTIRVGSLGDDCKSVDPNNIGYPCDSCQSYTSNQGCNHSYVNIDDPDAVLSITISSSEKTGKVSLITGNSTDTDTSIVVNPVTQETIGSAGSSGTINVKWSEICIAIAEKNNSTVASCAAAIASNSIMSETLYIGVEDDADTDSVFGSADDEAIELKIVIITDAYYATNTSVTQTTADTCTSTTEPGICKFEIFPGDEKVYLLSALRSSGDFPSASGFNFDNIVLFYNASDACSSFPDYRSNYKKLSITINSTDSTNFSVNKGFVSGLTNGTDHCFGVAVEDEAGNIVGFSGGTFSTSSHRANPDEVVGILEEGNCFIATASFGNPLSKELDTFRAFRDKILSQFNWGRQFIDFYYQVSKPIAYKIANNPPLKAMSQIFLWPVLIFAWLSLQTNFYTALLSYALGFGFLSYLAVKMKRKFH